MKPLLEDGLKIHSEHLLVLLSSNTGHMMDLVFSMMFQKMSSFKDSKLLMSSNISLEPVPMEVMMALMSAISLPAMHTLCLLSSNLRQEKLLTTRCTCSEIHGALRSHQLTGPPMIVLGLKTTSVKFLCPSILLQPIRKVSFSLRAVTSKLASKTTILVI
jgi:hypothetical protein